MFQGDVSVPAKRGLERCTQKLHSGVHTLDVIARPESRIFIDRQYFFYRFGYSRRRFPDYRFYCSWNICKSNTTFEESRHRHLVRRVQRDRLCTPCFDCLVRQT